MKNELTMNVRNYSMRECIIINKQFAVFSMTKSGQDLVLLFSID